MKNNPRTNLFLSLSVKIILLYLSSPRVLIEYYRCDVREREKEKKTERERETDRNRDVENTRVKNGAVSFRSFVERSSAGYEFRYEGVLEIRSVHRSDPRYRGETRKGMNADGTGKVFDGLWDRGYVEGRLYNFP